MNNKEIEWSIMDHNGIIHYSGDFTLMAVDGINYISTTDGYGNYIDLYEIIQLCVESAKAFDAYNGHALQLRFFTEDKNYCISQVQKMKNLYKDNFPTHVYINGDIIEFKYTESIFEVFAKFYKIKPRKIQHL